MRQFTVLQLKNRFNETIYAEIIDSPTRSGATRKANTLLAETFYVPVIKAQVDNYQYWHCHDSADLERLEDCGQCERSKRIKALLAKNEELLAKNGNR